MVEALLILDGASEPLDGETSLEAAATPNLDRLAAAGSVGRLQTVPVGLPVGSETAIPALLGWQATAPVDRGALEAAALGLELDEGERAWRVDVLGEDGGRAGAAATARAASELAELLGGHRVSQLRGHRLLVIGAPPLPDLGGAGELRVWPSGAVPPPSLDRRTVMVAAAGAATGAARLLGAKAVVPPGATGGVDTDLDAKARAAERALEAGAARVVVHIGAPDEASHLRDRAAKVAALERIDAELVPRLANAVEVAGGLLRICPDHGCDPRTGEHCSDPVPCLEWRAGSGIGAPGAGRLTERAASSACAVPCGVAAIVGSHAWEEAG